MTSAGFAGRVGGLAAALGAGVVVGLAVAAPAAADDSGAGDSSPRAAAAEHSAGRGASGAGQSTAVPRKADPVRSAAIVSAARVARTAAALAIPAPKAAAAVSGPTAKIPVAATPSATQSAAPLASAPASASAARGRRVTVFRGVHFVIPQSPAFFVKQVSGSGTFTTDSVYDLKDVDQYDWNKFTGIAFSPIQHDRNSVMVGWRYNLRSQEFEIAPFYNVDKERILPNEQTEVISVPAGETFQYNVDYSGVTISYGGATVFKPYPPGLRPNIWTAIRVSGWFGGNEVAPRTLTYYLKMK